MEIVGVVGATRNRGLDAEPEPEIFASSRQLGGFDNQHFLLLRTTVDPRSVLAAVRREVRALDPQQPVYLIQTVEEAFATSATPRRISTVALSLFAGFALILAAVGIYGVVAYSVGQRRREIGLRMALGAESRGVRRLVVRQALVPVAAGAAVGLAGALALGRMMASLLYQVSATDPVSILGVTVLLGGVAVLASYLPARRASRLDPMLALRPDGAP
jgi:ABC-type antimicrobial peptide transport system permease subunit